MKDNIRKFKTYAAWEYEKEEQDLNRYSQEGLQLVKGAKNNSEASVFKHDSTFFDKLVHTGYWYFFIPCISCHRCHNISAHYTAYKNKPHKMGKN